MFRNFNNLRLNFRQIKMNIFPLTKIYGKRNLDTK